MNADITVLSDFVSVTKIKSTHLFDTKYMLCFQEAQLMSNWQRCRLEDRAYASLIARPAGW